MKRCVVLCLWLLLKPCCVEMGGILCTMYSNNIFSSDFATAMISEMGFYDVQCSCLCLVLVLVLV